MECSICGDAVDDPFWDLYCPECEHEMFHDSVANFMPSCAFCCAEAEDRWPSDDEFEPEEAIAHG